MYLMAGMKLLGPHIFNEQHGITSPIFTNLVFQWIFEIFVSFHFFVRTWS